MSASEKLEALGKVPKATAADVGAAWALRNALPEIIAVVEAAEGCTDWHRPEGNFVRLAGALAALDEKLP